MKKIVAVLIVSVLAVFVIPGISFAAQKGVSLSGAGGGGEANDDIDIDVASGSIGFVLNVGKSSKLVMYRLNVDLAAGEIDYDDYWWYGDVSDDYQGLLVTNTLGFKVVNKPSFRIWAGGALYLGGILIDGDMSENDAAAIYGVGPTLGFDYDFSNGTTVSLEVAKRYLHADIDGNGAENADIDDLLFRISFLWGN